MVKTTDKIVLGVLVVLLVAVSGVFITAFSSNTNEATISQNKQLVVTDVSQQNANFLASEESEEKNDNEKEEAITGNALEKASAVALAQIGEGKVTDTEVGDEESYYEIEITLDNGDQVDVHLDENFKVISTEYEGEDDD